MKRKKTLFSILVLSSAGMLVSCGGGSGIGGAGAGSFYNLNVVLEIISGPYRPIIRREKVVFYDIGSNNSIIQTNYSFRSYLANLLLQLSLIELSYNF